MVGEKKNSNRGLVILLCFLLLLGLGLGLVIILVNNKKDDIGIEEMDLSGQNAEDIIEKYQGMIDDTSDNEKKAELYIERADLLSSFVSADSKEYCEQIVSDLRTANGISEDNYSAIDSILGRIIQECVVLKLNVESYEESHEESHEEFYEVEYVKF